MTLNISCGGAGRPLTRMVCMFLDMVLKYARRYPLGAFKGSLPPFITTMPGKHVHFAIEAQYYDDYSSPSASSFSIPSLPSDDDVSSPPSGLPYHHSPLADLPVITHSALVAGPVHFNYDVSLPPTPGVTLNHPTYHVSSLWDHPVTNPPTPFMEVECALLPWKITISPSRNSIHPYITFRDFFGSLYYNLRKQVKQAEYDQVNSPRLQTHIDNAYKRRYKRIPDYDQYEQELQGGVRRVDFLGEYVQFAGLSPNSNGRSRWTLQMAAPTPSHLS